MKYDHLSSPRGFYRDILNGLETAPKFLPHKYLYDDSGNGQISFGHNLEEYYFLDQEFGVLSRNISELTGTITAEGSPFNLIEFCAGAREKRCFVLTGLMKEKAVLQYFPVDISQDVINAVSEYLALNFPELEAKGLTSDYLDAIDDVSALSPLRKVILLLGTAVSNLTCIDAIDFFLSLRKRLVPGDLVILGMQLKTSPATLLTGQNDLVGVRKELNVNLLNRVNRELNSDFNIRKFEHFETYDPVLGAKNIFLISTEDQAVTVNGAHVLNFQKYEPIHMGILQFYSQEEIIKLAKKSGFNIIKSFSDTNYWFSNMVWVAK